MVEEGYADTWYPLTSHLLSELYDLENAFTFAFEQLYILIPRALLIRLLF